MDSSPPMQPPSPPANETELDRGETGNPESSDHDILSVPTNPSPTFGHSSNSLQRKDPGDSGVPRDNPSIGAAASDYIYNVKWIKFRDFECPVVTQNENGPCPIIAIANILSLRGVFTLPEKTELLTGQRLVSLLSDILLSQPPPSADGGQLLNYETTVSDAFNLFPSLQTGLDINVRFNGVGAFEFTPALGVFDLFKIPLYHGWVVDPEEKDLLAVVGERTYNQLVEQVISLKASADPEKVTQGLLVEEFLAQTASQLTYHGLCELASTIPDEHLAVLFRNNHYNALFKHEGRIYVLVTDMGLLHEPRVVWEVLNDVDGDTQFVDSAFRLYVHSTQATETLPSSKPPPTTEVSPSEFAVNQNAAFSHSQSNVSSIHDLEQACSERLKLPCSSSDLVETDKDLAARLQMAEIESSKQAAKVGTVPQTTSSSGSKSVPSDKLAHVCSENMLAQAQRELGTGSDLDVAVQLQWEEMNDASVSQDLWTSRRTNPRHRDTRTNSSPEQDRRNCTLL